MKKRIKRRSKRVSSEKKAANWKKIAHYIYIGAVVLVVLMMAWNLTGYPLHFSRLADQSAKTKATRTAFTDFHFESQDDIAVDCTLLLDCSGSMDQEIAVRDAAVRTFLSALPDNAKAALIFYDTSVIEELGSSSLLSIAKDREVLLEQLEKSSSFPYKTKRTDRNTAPASAVSKALTMLDQQSSNARKEIFLFTDGMPKGVYYGKEDTSVTKRFWKEFLKTAEVARQREVGLFVIHTPNSNSEDSEKTQKANRQEVALLCEKLRSPNAVTLSSNGVSASLTQWAEEELGKIVDISDISQLSSAFLSLFYEIQGWRTYSISSTGTNVSTLYLPDGVNQLRFYLETSALTDETSAELLSMELENGSTLSIPTPQSASGHYLYSFSYPRGGTYRIETASDGPIQIVAAARLSFDVSVNLKDTISPQQQDTLRILIANKSVPEDLDAHLWMTLYDSDGKQIEDAIPVEPDTPFSSLGIYAAADSGVTISLKASATCHGNPLSSDNDTAVFSLEDRVPVMTGASAVIFPLGWSGKIPMGRASDIVYDVESSNLRLVSSDSSLSPFIENDILYLTYSTKPFLWKSITMFAEDPVTNKRSEVVHMDIQVFPLLTTALIIILIAAIAFALDRAEKKKAIIAEIAATPWHGSVSWNENDSAFGSVPATFISDTNTGTISRRTGPVQVENCMVRTVGERYWVDIPSALKENGVSVEVYEYRGNLYADVRNATVIFDNKTYENGRSFSVNKDTRLCKFTVTVGKSKFNFTLTYYPLSDQTRGLC